jgi:hypothetical protein
MRLRLCAGVVTATLLVPTCSMAAGSSLNTPLTSPAAAATRSLDLPKENYPLGDAAPTGVTIRKRKSAAVQGI